MAREQRIIMQRTLRKLRQCIWQVYNNMRDPFCRRDSRCSYIIIVSQHDAGIYATSGEQQQPAAQAASAAPGDSRHWLQEELPLTAWRQTALPPRGEQRHCSAAAAGSITRS